MSTPDVEDPPLQEPIVQFSPESAKRLKLNVDNGDGKISANWFNWIWQAVLRRLNSAPAQFDSIVSEQGLTASQPSTAIGLPAIAQGRYRVSVHVKVRQAAGANSQILVSIGYTNNTVACAQSTTNLTTNTTGSVESKVMLIVADVSSPITWASTYVSAGAPSMSYDVDIVVEALN